MQNAKHEKLKTRKWDRKEQGLWVMSCELLVIAPEGQRHVARGINSWNGSV
jgi:hypothetical protein